MQIDIEYGFELTTNTSSHKLSLKSVRNSQPGSQCRAGGIALAAQALAAVWAGKADPLESDKVLGLKLSEPDVQTEIPAQVQAILDKRQVARDSKDFAK